MLRWQRLTVLLLACTAIAAPGDIRLGGIRYREVIWRDPGAVEKLDFTWGPGGRHGAPSPPFTFIREELRGTTPKVVVKDARGITWYVKWGPEAPAETFASKMAWAAGYFVVPSYFVPSGRIAGAKDLTRARKHLHPDGTFEKARFQINYDDFKLKKLKGHDWTWSNNPFVGTTEFNGLKIVVMLTSNWDSKDARNVDQFGSNTAIFAWRAGKRHELRYVVVDWGATMGKWGPILSGMAVANQWDCKSYTAQTADFMRGVSGGVIQWGYKGFQPRDVTNGIRAGDVRWLLQYLGRVSDEQIRAGLEASGSLPEERDCFAKAVRERITQLQQVAGVTERR
jgi:hypothetical protein